MKNFIDQCINGETTPDKIDDWVGEWHDNASITGDLHDYLGMTWDEYSRWATKPSLLNSILYNRIKQNVLNSLKIGDKLIVHRIDIDGIPKGEVGTIKSLGKWVVVSFPTKDIKYEESLFGTLIRREFLMEVNNET